MIIHSFLTNLAKKDNKIGPNLMFDANNISAKSYVCHIRLIAWLQSGSNVKIGQIIWCFLGIIHFVFLYLIYEYSEEHFQPKIGRKKKNIIVLYLILISIDFLLRFFSPLFLIIFSFDWKDRSNTQDSVEYIPNIT